MEQACLLERILPLARIEHEQNFVRRGRIDPAHDALHLLALPSSSIACASGRPSSASSDIDTAQAFRCA